nr:transposase [Actinomadura bangladeshensis]
MSIRPCHGTCWARRKKPDRLPATYHRAHGIRYFHGCYSLGDDQLWGVVRRRKGADHTLAALKSIRSARPDGAPIYVILDNLSANKTPGIRAWAKKSKVNLCFTPTSASWASPIEAQFGPLRTFVMGNSNHPNHTVLNRELHAYLRWRNANARHPDVLAAQRSERARIRSERRQRWAAPDRKQPDLTRQMFLGNGASRVRRDSQEGVAVFVLLALRHRQFSAIQVLLGELVHAGLVRVVLNGVTRPQQGTTEVGVGVGCQPLLISGEHRKNVYKLPLITVRLRRVVATGVLSTAVN